MRYTEFHDIPNYLLLDIIGPKIVLLNKICYLQCKDILPSYMAKKNEITICIAIKKLLISKKDNIELIKKIYNKENIFAAKYQTVCISPYINNIIRLAAGNGCIQILQYFLESYGNNSNLNNAISSAIRQSQYNSIRIILEYTRRKKIEIDQSIITRSIRDLLNNIYVTKYLDKNNHMNIYEILWIELIKFHDIGLQIDNIKDITNKILFLTL